MLESDNSSRKANLLLFVCWDDKLNKSYYHNYRFYVSLSRGRKRATPEVDMLVAHNDVPSVQ